MSKCKWKLIDAFFIDTIRGKGGQGKGQKGKKQKKKEQAAAVKIKEPVVVPDLGALCI